MGLPPENLMLGPPSRCLKPEADCSSFGIRTMKNPHALSGFAVTLSLALFMHRPVWAATGRCMKSANERATAKPLRACGFFMVLIPNEEQSASGFKHLEGGPSIRFSGGKPI